MVTSRKLGQFWLNGLVLLILLISLVRVVVSSRGLLFNLELLGFLVLLVLSVWGIITPGSRRRQRVFFAIFVLYIINLLLLWWVQRKLYVVLVLLALVGLFNSLMKPAKMEMHKDTKTTEQKTVQQKTEEPHSMVFDTLKSTVSKESAKKSKLAVNFSPGKYVASKASNVYHEPTCDWAKKIASNRRVWFAEKKEAWAKGYKKHGCVA